MSEGFFEFQQRTAKDRAAIRAKGKTVPASPSAGEAPLTVTQLTAMIDKAIKTGVPAAVAVRGEISNVSGKQASGHLYFTLKDSGACISCVMWRDAASKLPFKLEDGMEMIATGRVTLYAPQGRYQLTAATLQPIGQGALELAFRQLRAKLQAEGLFDPERKKPILLYPMRIAMVTSRATAALQDMLKVLRRFAWLKLMLYHVPVQGEGSGEKIASAIRHLNERAHAIGGVDVILLARGGGSLEDLWAFNEEIVVRAVADSAIPIVTGIGHEVDVSIADLAADHHAHTPTEAAQVISAHWKNASSTLEMSGVRLRRGLRQVVETARQRITAVRRHEFFRRPLDRIQMFRQLLDDRQRALSLALADRLRASDRKLSRAQLALQQFHPRHQINLLGQRLATLRSRLHGSISFSLATRATRLNHLDHQLHAVSPKAVLSRGYTITILKKTGEILRTAGQLKSGDRIITRFHDGQSESLVQDSRQMSLFE